MGILPPSQALLAVIVWIGGTVATIRLTTVWTALEYSIVCGCVLTVANFLSVKLSVVPDLGNRSSMGFALPLGMIVGFAVGVFIWALVLAVAKAISLVVVATENSIPKDKQDTTEQNHGL
jgi:hypothetical protein